MHELLISGYALSWERHSENIYQVIFIVLLKYYIDTMITIGFTKACFGVRGCQWILCEEYIGTNNWPGLIKLIQDILNIEQVVFFWVSYVEMVLGNLYFGFVVSHMWHNHP